MTFHSPPKDEFAARLLTWFAEAERPLPWRRTYEPYGVWVSEIMLQQTQAERGARCFEAWMRRFPDLRSLAEADEEEVLAAWEGLGYYSRARNLHAAARWIMDMHGGRFPQAFEHIRALPGVGEYTAGAVAAIAFNQPVPAVDANVRRVLARVCDIDVPLDGPEAKNRLTETARALIPPDAPRLFNQALMELGALVCAKKPQCGRCPVAEFCLARRRGTAAERPVKKPGPGYTHLEMVAGVVARKDGAVFIRKRPPGGLWGGLWEFPGGSLPPGEEPERALERHIIEQTGLTVTAGDRIAVVRHGYLNRRVTLHGYFCGLSGDPDQTAEGIWARPGELAGCAFPAGPRKLLEHLGWK